MCAERNLAIHFAPQTSNLLHFPAAAPLAGSWIMLTCRFEGYFLLHVQACAIMCNPDVWTTNNAVGGHVTKPAWELVQGPSMHAETMLWGLDEHLQALKGVGCNSQGVR